MNRAIRFRLISLTAFGLICLAGAASGHATWVWLEPTRVEPGQPVTVRLLHGHRFPDGESTPGAEGLTLVALTPDGRREPLSIIHRDGVRQSVYQPVQPGRHWLILEQNRGVRSQTARGWQPGGRSQHPDARRHVRFYTSALAALDVGRTNGQGESIGLDLPFTLTAHRQGDQLRLRVTADGVPVPGVGISWQGSGTDPAAIGSTGLDGSILWRPSPFPAKPFLLIAEQRGPVADQVEYGELAVSATLLIDVR